MRTGKIITFYSYKGGVGRSMALANIAQLLADWNYKVLIIDWDLEAPGLENFFNDHLKVEKIKTTPGIIDILEQSKSLHLKSSDTWKQCIVKVPSVSFKGQLDLITAGNRDDDYYKKVRGFDFSEFYRDHDGGSMIEELRRQWKQEYDFVLIDSRTGVTDIGGVCTIQLPDILVLLFTPTHHGFEGICNVAEKAIAGRKQLPYDRVNLQILPLLTRLDNSEYKLSQKWVDFFAERLSPFYHPWLPVEVDRKEFILCTKIPYISFFSYDESLPVLEEGLLNPSGMGYAYESVSALLANHLEDAKLMTLDRTKLIQLARKEKGIPIHYHSAARPRLALSGPRRVREKLLRTAKLAAASLVFAVALLFALEYYAAREQSEELRRRVRLAIKERDSMQKALIDNEKSLYMYQHDNYNMILKKQDSLITSIKKLEFSKK